MKTGSSIINQQISAKCEGGRASLEAFTETSSPAEDIAGEQVLIISF